MNNNNDKEELLFTFCVYVFKRTIKLHILLILNNFQFKCDVIPMYLIACSFKRCTFFFFLSFSSPVALYAVLTPVQSFMLNHQIHVDQSRA